MTIALSLLALLAPTAHAGSISTAGVTGGPDSGAATANVAAIAYNPAAIGAIEGFEAMVDGQFTFVGIETTTTRNDGIDPNTGKKYEPANAKAMVPNAVIGVVYSPIKQLSLGFAAYDPFVGGGDYSGESGGPPYTTHQRYHIGATRIISLALAPAIAVTPVDGIHIGGSFTYNLDSLSVSQASDPLGTEGIKAEQLGQDVPDDPYAMDTLLEGDMSGSHVGWSAGVFFDKIPEAQIGLSYASGGEMSVEGEGQVGIPETLAVDGEALTVPAAVSANLKLPPVARLYVNSQINDKLNVGAGIDWQLWNTCCGGEDGDIAIGLKSKDDVGSEDESIGPDDGVAISIADVQYSPRRLWNSMNFVTMAGYQANEQLWLGGRLGYNQNAVPDYAVSPSNLDFQSITAVIGGRFTIAEKLTLGLNYSKFFLMKRTITDSAWDLRDGNERFSPELPYKSGTNGTYSGTADSLGVRIGFKM